MSERRPPAGDAGAGQSPGPWSPETINRALARLNGLLVDGYGERAAWKPSTARTMGAGWRPHVEANPDTAAALWESWAFLDALRAANDPTPPEAWPAAAITRLLRRMLGGEQATAAEDDRAELADAIRRQSATINSMLDERDELARRLEASEEARTLAELAAQRAERRVIAAEQDWRQRERPGVDVTPEPRYRAPLAGTVPDQLTPDERRRLDDALASSPIEPGQVYQEPPPETGRRFSAALQGAQGPHPIDEALAGETAELHPWGDSPDPAVYYRVCCGYCAKWHANNGLEGCPKCGAEPRGVSGWMMPMREPE